MYSNCVYGDQTVWPDGQSYMSQPNHLVAIFNIITDEKNRYLEANKKKAK